jgi:dTDP-4-dehydrorhamnose reductase
VTGVLLFGATSLVGSHFAETAGPEFELAIAGRTRPVQVGVKFHRFESVDLGDVQAVDRLVRAAKEQVVVNFAARTNVDGVEKERLVDIGPAAEASEAYRVNALAPEAMARAAAATGKSFLTISTDFVFDGRRGPYSENDRPDPFGPLVSWYGWTKGEGERRVRKALPRAMIVRISYPFRTPYGGKTDFAGWIRAHGQLGDLPPMYTDQQVTPTWIPDVTRSVASLVRNPQEGTFHVASPTPTTPFQFATYLLELLSGSRPALAEGSLARRLGQPGVTPRPLRGGLLPGSGRPEESRATAWDAALRELIGRGAGK